MSHIHEHDEEEEEEPQLRYQRLGSPDLRNLMKKDSISCMTVAKHFIAHRQ
jgi:hypothetical protein